MKLKAIKSLIAMTAFAVLGSSVIAQDKNPAFQPVPISDSALFRAHEFQIDLFGTLGFSSSESEQLFDEETGGGGIGLNYFFTRNFGIGIEGMVFDTDGDTLGSTAVNFFVRAPIGNSGLALYGLAGAGILFNTDGIEVDGGSLSSDDNNDDVVFETHVGLGVEYRFTKNFGVFTDARYTFADRDDSDFFSGRAGFRIAF